jgi:hypothetical protein
VLLIPASLQCRRRRDLHRLPDVLERRHRRELPVAAVPASAHLMFRTVQRRTSHRSGGAASRCGAGVDQHVSGGPSAWLGRLGRCGRPRWSAGLADVRCALACTARLRTCVEPASALSSFASFDLVTMRSCDDPRPLEPFALGLGLDLSSPLSVPAPHICNIRTARITFPPPPARSALAPRSVTLMRLAAIAGRPTLDSLNRRPSCPCCRRGRGKRGSRRDRRAHAALARPRCSDPRGDG